MSWPLILFHLLIGTSVSSRKAIVDSNEINLDEEANVDEESFRSDLERDSAHSSMTWVFISFLKMYIVYQL